MNAMNLANCTRIQRVWKRHSHIPVCRPWSHRASAAECLISARNFARDPRACGVHTHASSSRGWPDPKKSTCVERRRCVERRGGELVRLRGACAILSRLEVQRVDRIERRRMVRALIDVRSTSASVDLVVRRTNSSRTWPIGAASAHVVRSRRFALEDVIEDITPICGKSSPPGCVD